MGARQMRCMLLFTMMPGLYWGQRQTASRCAIARASAAPYEWCYDAVVTLSHRCIFRWWRIDEVASILSALRVESVQ